MDRTLLEDSRRELVAKAKAGRRQKSTGQTRYQKRLKSRVSSSTSHYNRINMNKLFKDGILDIDIEVRGETDTYLVKLSFGGLLDAIYSELTRFERTLDLRTIIRAITLAFNKEEVYIACTCFDWKYRFRYFATVNKINSGSPEFIPSDQTNPDDTLGPGCKHTLLVLSNTAWIIKVASVITNYINYMKQHRERQYKEIIYPALYKKEYEDEPTQLDIFDDELETDPSVIDKSNEEARKKGQFKKDNQYRFQPTPDANQIDIDDSEVGEEEDDTRI